MSDAIAEMISSIKNGYLAKKTQVGMPYSKFKKNILEVLKEEGFLEKVSVAETDSKKNLICFLKYQDKNPSISSIKMVSKPGLRVYGKSKRRKLILGGLGVRIISTTQGVMTDKKAKKNNLGGELILEVY